MSIHFHLILLFLCHPLPLIIFFFFFNDTATTEIYTLSLHDALPILYPSGGAGELSRWDDVGDLSRQHQQVPRREHRRPLPRSEEHTSELQSPCNLVCRLLLEKKKNK